MSQYYYRVTVNEARGVPMATYPGAQWERIAELCEERGWEATLERQLLIDNGALVDTRGYVRFGDKVATPWTILAEMKPHTAVLIGGE